MPRKGPAPRRELMPDPIYRSVVVTQLVNKVLLRGQALDRPSTSSTTRSTRSSRKTGGDPVAVLKRAVENVRPQLEVQEPPGRWRHLPGAGRGPAPPGHHARDPLDRRLLPPAAGEDDGRAPAGELLDASNGIGAAIKRRDDLQKMAESNKAFAHYRW